MLQSRQGPLGFRAALADPPASDEQVRGWTLQVEHDLRDDEELLTIFRYEPYVSHLERFQRSMTQAILDALSGGPLTQELARRLQQLNVVIERLEDSEP
jgi:hypothetical protein